MLRMLLWDVDGTLFDTNPAFARAFSLVLAAEGIAVPPAEIEALTRQSLSYCAETLAETYELEAESLLGRFSVTYREIPYAEQPPFAGVQVLCEYVREIGGDNFIVTHRGRESLKGLLEHFEMGDLFRDQMTGDDGLPRKPAPTSFLTMMARHDLIRAEVVAIGDRAIDVAAGRAAGVRTCYFGNEPAGTEADYPVQDYGELLEVLRVENELVLEGRME